MLNFECGLVLRRRRRSSLALVVFLIFSVGWTSNAAANPAFDQFLASAGEWLEARQLPSGAFPYSEADPTVFPSVQSVSGLAMLAAYEATCRLGNCNTDFLDSAVLAGDYMIGGGFGNFSPNTGLPRIRTFDPLLLVRLSEATGDPQYADFIQVNFWQRLEDGIYGPQNNWDIDDYVASELARRAGAPSTGPIVAAWDLALIAAAAREAGINQFNASLAVGASTALESATDAGTSIGASGFDVLGLTGAVWMGALTGLSTVPGSGPWSGVAGNSGLASLLMQYQGPQGGFLQSSAAGSSPVQDVDTVSQNTAFAIVGLHQLNRVAYGHSILRGQEALVEVFQEPSGRVNYYHPDVDLSSVADPKPYLHVHAYALFALADTRDLPDPAPVPVNDWRLLSLLALLMLVLGWTGLVVRRQ